VLLVVLSTQEKWPPGVSEVLGRAAQTAAGEELHAPPPAALEVLGPLAAVLQRLPLVPAAESALSLAHCFLPQAKALLL
jgi:hypothetical protein